MSTTSDSLILCSSDFNSSDDCMLTDVLILMPVKIHNNLSSSTFLRFEIVRHVILTVTILKLLKLLDTNFVVKNTYELSYIIKCHDLIFTETSHDKCRH